MSLPGIVAAAANCFMSGLAALPLLPWFGGVYVCMDVAVWERSMGRVGWAAGRAGRWC